MSHDLFVSGHISAYFSYGACSIVQLGQGLLKKSDTILSYYCPDFLCRVCQMNENTPEGLVMLTFVVRVATPIHQPQMEALKPLTQFWYSYFLNMLYATKTRIKHTADFLLIRFLGTDPHEAPRLMLNHDPFMDF